MSKASIISTGQQVAIKTIDKSKLKINTELLMMQELEILKEVSHPHIMRVIELLHDKNNYYIVTELMEGGELFDRILEVEKFN